LREPKGRWDGKEILFWSQQPGENADPSVFRGLLGVDLEQPSGKYEFAVTAETQSGETVTCTANVFVRAGHFAIESLQVAKQFVEPDPEQLKRGQEEQKRLRAIFATVTPERLWQGTFRIPLDGVASGKNFGKRRILNGQAGSPHGGVDLPGVTGTPVYASQSGQIVLAEELFFSGNTVVIDHGLGIYTLYGHLSEISVKAGDAVSPGALLGKVGATGRVTGPHLHWGLTVCRSRVDPLQIVKLLPGE
jgi:murein DD-endopeptidase MepM/ murein hydrolase activator NlpD